MSCGCSKRAQDLEDQTGIPAWYFHAGLGLVAAGGAVAAWRISWVLSVILAAASLYALNLAKDARDGI